jgi:sulfoxide reductase heme-binding subunit YedZ
MFTDECYKLGRLMNMISSILHLPLWQIIRSTGVIAYLFLTLGMCLGILYSFPIWKGKTKANLYKWHTVGTISGTAVGLLHGITTVIDTYVPFSWQEVLIPFAARTDPVWNGLGTLAGYGMLFVILTTDLRNKIGKKVWLTLHMLSYPVFVMSLLHGYFAGSDSAQPGIRFMYVMSIILILSLTIMRGFARDAIKDRAKGSRNMKKAI